MRSTGENDGKNESGEEKRKIDTSEDATALKFVVWIEVGRRGFLSKFTDFVLHFELLL